MRSINNAMIDIFSDNNAIVKQINLKIQLLMSSHIGFPHQIYIMHHTAGNAWGLHIRRISSSLTSKFNAVRQILALIVNPFCPILSGCIWEVNCQLNRIPQLMNFNRLLKFGFIFQSNTPQKHIKERLLQLAVHQLTNLDGTFS